MRKILPIIIMTLVAAALIGGGFYFLRGKNRSYQIQSGQPQTLIQYDNCVTGVDCILVQDGWCKTVLAINKNNKAAWQEENARQTEIARQSRQTCKLMPEEYLDINNFRAVCEQSRCIAEFIGSLAQ